MRQRRHPTSCLNIRDVANHRLSNSLLSGCEAAWSKRPAGPQRTPYSAARRCAGGQSTTSPRVVYVFPEVFSFFML